MESELRLEMLPQPDDTACGPTCLHAIYRYFGDQISLDQVIREAPTWEHGGTIAVFLACHALERGYEATIYTYNLVMFDPTWFTIPGVDIAARLRLQQEHKPDPRIEVATTGYLRFLELGGKLRFEDLTSGLIRGFLKNGQPILTGLSSTYLYHSSREFGPADEDDDVRGSAQGHFAILAGYDSTARSVLIADPYLDNPVAGGHFYKVPIERTVGAILLGVLTFDANLLIIRPRGAADKPGTKA